jgi:hypothetical protein
MSSATGPRSVPTIVREAEATPDGVLRMASMGASAVTFATTGLSRRGASRRPNQKIKQCDPAHTLSERGLHICVALSPAAGRGVRAMEGAMLKAILCNRSASRVEIDQRARDARLRLEQIERLLASRAALTASSLSRVLCLFGFARPGEGWRASRTPGPLNNRRPRVPQIHPGWVPSAP